MLEKIIIIICSERWILNYHSGLKINKNKHYLIKLVLIQYKLYKLSYLLILSIGFRILFPLAINLFRQLHPQIICHLFLLTKEFPNDWRICANIFNAIYLKFIINDYKMRMAKTYSKILY